MTHILAFNGPYLAYMLHTSGVQNGSLLEACRPGIAALKAHWRPVVLIQVAALILLVAYYQMAGVQEWAHGVSALKLRWGLPFSFLAGYIAGGVLPELAKLVAGRPSPLKESAFNGLAYGLLGVLIDLFYQLQAFWFGPGNDIGTLLIKNFVDMVIVAPLVFVPFMILLFEWRKSGFKAATKVYTKAGYIKKVIPALLPNWAFWIPVLFCVYAMPSDLQFIFSTLMEAAWSIVFVFIASQE